MNGEQGNEYTSRSFLEKGAIKPFYHSNYEEHAVALSRDGSSEGLCIGTADGCCVLPLMDSRCSLYTVSRCYRYVFDDK
jgi:hypothetical protein